MRGLFQRRETIACAGVSWTDASRSQAALEDALALHRVRPSALEDDEIGFVAEFRGGRLHTVLEPDPEAPRHERRLVPVRGTPPDLEVAPGPIRRVTKLGASASARSRLGGAFPDVRIEAGVFPYPVSPFAEFSSADPVFSWLPFDLCLAFPFTAEVHEPPIWFDYSDPSGPAVLEGDWFTTGDHGHGLGPEDRFVLEETSFGEVPTDARRAGLTRAGVPNWEQVPEPPRSPVTGERMAFVAQIQSASLPSIAAVETGAALPPRLADRPRVGFWSDGTLYVFLEAETRLVALVVQG